MGNVVINWKAYTVAEYRCINLEAIRHDYMAHVDQPQNPKPIYGDMTTVYDKLLNKFNNRQPQLRKLRLKDGTYSCRMAKTPKNAKVIMAGYVSFPKGMREESPDLYEKWVKLNVQWLKARFGKQLQAIVEHNDESSPHLHFVVMPNDLEIASICPAEKKQRDLSTQGVSRPEQRAAYGVEKSKIIDEYFNYVGVQSGLMRNGPKSAPAVVGTGKQYHQNKAKVQQAAIQTVQLEKAREKIVKSEKNRQRRRRKTRQVINNNVGLATAVLVAGSAADKQEIARLKAELAAKDELLKQVGMDGELVAKDEQPNVKFKWVAGAYPSQKKRQPTTTTGTQNPATHPDNFDTDGGVK